MRFAVLMGLLLSTNVLAADYLIDVREPNEYAEEHAKHAINIPHEQIVEGVKKHNFQKDDQLYVYCRTGKRASMAKDALNKEGFQKVEVVGGWLGVQDGLKARDLFQK